MPSVIIVLSDNEDGDVDIHIEAKPAMPQHIAWCSPAQQLAVELLEYAEVEVEDWEFELEGDD